MSHNYLAEEPDLDLSLLVSEYGSAIFPTSTLDSTIPYFDNCGEDAENLAALETSIASLFEAGLVDACNLRMPSHSSTDYSYSAEIPRALDLHSESMADIMAEITNSSFNNEVALSAEDWKSGVVEITEEEVHEAPEMSATGRETLRQMESLCADADFARSIRIIRSKISREIDDDSVEKFLVHMIRYPMRRPLQMLLSAHERSPELVYSILNTCSEPLHEPHLPNVLRDAYFRITLKNSVDCLRTLYTILGQVYRDMRGEVTINYSLVRGRMAFIGFNDNLPIKMEHPIEDFVKRENQARDINATYSVDVHICRRDDPRREIIILYYDTVERPTPFSAPIRVTEVNIYHIIHPERGGLFMASPVPVHEFCCVPVGATMAKTSSILDHKYSLDDAFEFLHKYRQR